MGSTVGLLEEAGFEVRDVESLREHYALTLRPGSPTCRRMAAAIHLAGLGRARVWRLYMAACALAFEENRIGVNQVLAVRTEPAGAVDCRSAVGPGSADPTPRRAPHRTVPRAWRPAPRQPDGLFDALPDSARILPR